MAEIIRHGNFSVVTANLDHLLPVAEKMRQADRDECMAGCGLGPYEVLQRSIAASPLAWTVLEGTEPVAMFGVSQRALLSSTGIPWFLGAEGMERAGSLLPRFSRQVVQAWLTRYDRLENWVDARYEKSVRWLRWIGFTVEEPLPWGVAGLPFHHFWMERG